MTDAPHGLCKELGEGAESLDYFHLPELDIIHDGRPLKKDCSVLQQTKGAGLSGTHFVIFVTPLATLLC